ncbi:MAG TPA: HAD family hydrolase [Vicinamibacterales bacterium]|nr:HAD family hydrolase [Vicinamibacterales bacterium]
MSANPVPIDRRPAPEGGTCGLRNPLDPTRRIRAVLFDLDGTLYRQMPMRSLMAIELLTLPLSGVAKAPQRWRALRTYRKTQEQLRSTDARGSAAQAQLAAAARRTGLPVEEVEKLVEEWMLARPLKYLRLCRAKGLDRLLGVLENAGVRSGVLSDYPAESKLGALGLSGRFSPVLCTSAPDVAALKPSPRGFLLACRSWRLTPGEVLYVGDRPDVDAAGASAAGMPCVIIGGGWRSLRRYPGYLVLRSLERLCDVLDDRR